VRAGHAVLLAAEGEGPGAQGAGADGLVAAAAREGAGGRAVEAPEGTPRRLHVQKVRRWVAEAARGGDRNGGGEAEARAPGGNRGRPICNIHWYNQTMINVINHGLFKWRGFYPRSVMAYGDGWVPSLRPSARSPPRTGRADGVGARALRGHDGDDAVPAQGAQVGVGAEGALW